MRSQIRNVERERENGAARRCEPMDERRYIDVARGIAIFMMLWGHCVQYCCAGSFDFFENGVFRVIYSFHMPLFMLISGYLFFFSFQKRELRELLVHRTQALLQPIIMCYILLFLLVYVFQDVFFGHNYSSLFSGGWIRGLGYYWFLWSVLAASLAVGISCKVTDRLWLQIVFVILGVFFVAMFPNVESNVYMYPYFVLGFFYARFRNENWMKQINIIKYVSIPAFPIMMLFFKKEHYIYTSGLGGEEGLLRHMPVNLFRWAIGLVGCIFVLTLLELVFRFILPKIKSPLLSYGLSRLGEKSLQVYTLSCIVLSCYLPIVYAKFIEITGHNVFAENMAFYNFVFV